LAQFLDFVVAGVALGCIYSLIALGFTMIIRSSGVLNFAQGETVMIGAMAGLSVHSAFPVPFPILVLCGMIGGGLIALAAELIIYRRLRSRKVETNNIVIATVGVSIILQNVAQLIWGAKPIAYPRIFGDEQIKFGPIELSPQLLGIIVMGFAVLLGLHFFLQFTRWGRAMRATAEDPLAAAAVGINLDRAAQLTWGLSGILGGAAGVLFGSLFYASFNMGFLPGIKAFVAATLGGLGSIPGAMAGGILFGLIEVFSGAIISTGYKDAVGMGLLIGLLLIWPTGLAGIFGGKR